MPTISLALGERSYDIHVENGALDRTGEFAYHAGLDGKIAVITDSCVAPLYAERVMKSLESAGFMPSLHVVNAGEASKICFRPRSCVPNWSGPGLTAPDASPLWAAA